MADPKAVETKDNTDARDQFIALGVGVIVGRCGRDIASPVSALTPPLLSWIGREWVVFPARLVVVEMAYQSFHKAKEFVRFSVSPTLGLVRHPTMINFGINNKVTYFYGWVGSQSSGDRFALTMAQAADDSTGAQKLVVIDTSGHSEDLRLCNWRSLSGPWCNNRRWIAATKKMPLTSSLTLWNLDGVESGSVSKVEDIDLPWKVSRAAFGGDDSSLVVSQPEGGIMVIDLEATFSQSRLVCSPVQIAAVDRRYLIDQMICWNGVLYALLSGGDGSTWVQCLTTGLSTKLSRGNTEPLGGPYVAVFETKDNTDARDQFIALGVGVIVGRCGRDTASPVSALTPPLLSWIGREWIVFPARLVMVELAYRSVENAKEFVRFSVSPTLGLVRRPTMIDFRGNNNSTYFYGWVGPQSSGDRFALTASQAAADTGAQTQVLAVIDTSGHSEDLRLCNWLSLTGPWCNNRRWVAATKRTTGTPLTSSLTLWNLDGVERGSITKVEGVSMPWNVDWAAFGDDSSLVVSQSGGIMVIGLEATFSESRLVWTPVQIADFDRTYLDHIICWNGRLYALLYGTDRITWVQCLTTGGRTKLSGDYTVPLGGPYVAVCTSSAEECGVDVCSIVEPTKVCVQHRAQNGIERFVLGREMVFWDSAQTTTEVIDAVTGFVVFKMAVTGCFVASVS
ncbi:hypothetical protein Pelo_17637 [Pelomyxa schiedti]|nr:hypothetical protein Pelo_17637 [Pelomyxa schiedti]